MLTEGQAQMAQAEELEGYPKDKGATEGSGTDRAKSASGASWSEDGGWGPGELQQGRRGAWLDRQEQLLWLSW